MIFRPFPLLSRKWESSVDTLIWKVEFKDETMAVTQVGSTSTNCLAYTKCKVVWAIYDSECLWCRTFLCASELLEGFAYILTLGLRAFENNIMKLMLVHSFIPSEDHILQSGTRLVSEGFGKANAVVSPVKFSVVLANETGTQKPQRTQWRRNIQSRKRHRAEVLPIERMLQREWPSQA